MYLLEFLNFIPQCINSVHQTPLMKVIKIQYNKTTSSHRKHASILNNKLLKTKVQKCHYTTENGIKFLLHLNPESMLIENTTTPTVFTYKHLIGSYI